LAGESGLTMHADRLHFRRYHELLKFCARRIFDNRDRVPKFFDFANHQPVNAAGEQEPASGALDNLPHLGPVAHIRYLASDGFRASVLERHRRVH